MSIWILANPGERSEVKGCRELGVIAATPLSLSLKPQYNGFGVLGSVPTEVVIMIHISLSFSSDPSLAFVVAQTVAN